MHHRGEVNEAGDGIAAKKVSEAAKLHRFPDRQTGHDRNTDNRDNPV